MKNFCKCLGGVLIFLCLFGSCSGGTDPGKSVPLEEEEEGIEEKEKDPGKDPGKDETKEDEKGEDDTENIEDPAEEIPPEPIFLYCKAVSEKEIVFGFSQSVTMGELRLSTGPEHEITLEHEEITGEGKTIKVSLKEDLKSGQVLTADFQAEDAYGNSINKQVLFSSTATRAPALLINELRTEYSGSSTPKKAEFIEFKMLSDGNLGGLRVFSVVNNKITKIYEFDSVKVKEGEYVVLHLRTLEESCKNEFGEKLDVSGGSDSCPTARDLWVPESNKLLHKTDAVYVQDLNSWVLDAIMLSESPSAPWGKTCFIEAADLFFSQGAWKSPADTVCSPADAVNTSGIKTSTSKSICRNEDAENTHTAADWYITTQGVTPGLPNKL
jgi:hypothetical protein